MILPQLREHGADLRERLFRSHARFQAGNRLQVVAEPVQIGRVNSHRQPELRALRNRVVFRQAEIRRHYPDDGDRIVIQTDHLAENVRVPVVLTLPHLITQDRHLLTVWRFVFPAKSPAEGGLNPQRFKDARRHPCDRDALRLILIGQVCAPARVAADLLKRLIPGPQPRQLRF